MAQTAEAKKYSFNKAGFKRLPTLVCTGYVADVADGRESKAGKYNIVTVEINGLGGSKNAKLYPCTRPEWFALDEEGNPSFRVSDYDDVEGGESMQKTYAANISQQDGVSTLQGLAGSQERFDALQEAFFTNPDVSDPAKSAKAIEGILAEQLVAPQGADPFEIGYVLKQQTTKTGRKTAEGKDEYINTKYYQIDSFFEATDENKKKYRAIAKKSAKRAEDAGETCYYRVAFDDGSPF